MSEVTVHQVPYTSLPPFRLLWANLFNYFVVPDSAEADVVLSKILEGIIGTRLQYHFEFVITEALVDYDIRSGLEDVPQLNLCQARKYKMKLLRQDLELFTLLSE